MKGKAVISYLHGHKVSLDLSRTYVCKTKEYNQDNLLLEPLKESSLIGALESEGVLVEIGTLKDGRAAPRDPSEAMKFISLKRAYEIERHLP